MTQAMPARLGVHTPTLAACTAGAEPYDNIMDSHTWRVVNHMKASAAVMRECAHGVSLSDSRHLSASLQKKGDGRHVYWLWSSLGACRVQMAWACLVCVLHRRPIRIHHTCTRRVPHLVRPWRQRGGAGAGPTGVAGESPHLHARRLGVG